MLYVLFEHASGYGLFLVKEFEEVAAFNNIVQESVSDLSKFQSVVKFVAFLPFESGVKALENINHISEGLIHDDLRIFLESNVPMFKKKEVSLGVSDSKLGANIGESLKLSCEYTGVIPEIMRGLRLHFAQFIKGMTSQISVKAQLGLGHSYSRSKVKFNVNKADNMIIQSISLLDQLDKDVNTFAMRVKEWYSYHFPELVRFAADNQTYARAVKLIGNRKTFDENKHDALEKIIMDSGKVKAIVAASKISMGMEISDIDLINIQHFSSRVIGLSEYRTSLYTYLVSRMNDVAPNLGTLIGEQVAARLISHAGSLTNLAKYPASTVQILGAEKALFRALKTKGNTPKYGLIFHSSFIGRAGTKNKGRISRYLANKCSIASRIDCFAEIPTTVYGDFFKKQVEDRLKFYEEKIIPPKNVDVMKEAIAQALVVSKKIRKKQKKLLKETSIVEIKVEAVPESLESPKKKSKKHKNLANGDAGAEAENVVVKMETEETPVKEKSKKKKKRKSDALNEPEPQTVPVETGAGDAPPSKKKKKSKKNKTDE